VINGRFYVVGGMDGARQITNTLLVFTPNAPPVANPGLNLILFT
jgi:hypothetical protein